MSSSSKYYSAYSRFSPLRDAFFRAAGTQAAGYGEVQAPSPAAEWWKKNQSSIGAIVLRAAGIRPPQVNDVVRFSGQKRWIVAHVKGSSWFAVAMSGAEKGSVQTGDAANGKSMEPDVLDAHAAWIGKEARERYDQYAAYMAKFGHADKVLPFDAATLRAAEVRRVPADDETPDVVVSHTVTDGTIATFAKNAAIASVVRQHGFVWAPSVGVWRRLHSVGTPRPSDSLSLATLKARLNAAGFKVAFQIVEGVGLEAEREALAVRASYVEKRAEGAARGAERAAIAAQQHAQAAGASASEALAKLDIPGYYPTPPELVARVIEAADIEPGDAVLEPSAGAGALAEAARQAGADVDVIEINMQLRSYLGAQGFAVVGADVMETPPAPIYSVVVMNPPFEKKQDIAHVRRVYDAYVRPGGRLVAIMAGGRTDPWLDTVDADVENLPPTTFGRATVSTRLVIIDRPASDVVTMDEGVLAQITAARKRAGRSDAGAIAASLVEKAGTSRRAARSLERHKRLAKEEGRAAHDLAARAEHLKGVAARAAHAAETRTRTLAEMEEFNTTIARLLQHGLKRDVFATRVVARASGTGAQAFKKQIGVMFAASGRADEGGDRRSEASVVLDATAAFVGDGNRWSARTPVLVPYGDRDAVAVYADIVEVLRPYAPTGPVALSLPAEMLKRIHGGAKRDLGASNVRTTGEGRYIVWGGLSGRYGQGEHALQYVVSAAREAQPSAWDESKREGHGGRVEGFWGTRSYMGKQTPDVVVDLAGRDVDSAYAEWVAKARALVASKMPAARTNAGRRSTTTLPPPLDSDDPTAVGAWLQALYT